MNLNKLAFIFLIGLIGLVVSCNRNPSELVFKSESEMVKGNALIRGEAPLSFKSLQKYILRPKCMSCHSGENAKPKNDPIDFTTYETTMIDRFIPLLKKGIPEKSRLYLSVEDGSMPVDGSLTFREVDFIKKWIEACAPKDEIASGDSNCEDDGPGDDEPGDDGPGDDEPGDDGPGDDGPGDDEPGDDEPGDDEPGDDEPGDDEPGDDEPGDDEPGDDEPGDD